MGLFRVFLKVLSRGLFLGLYRFLQRGHEEKDCFVGGLSLQQRRGSMRNGVANISVPCGSVV